MNPLYFNNVAPILSLLAQAGSNPLTGTIPMIVIMIVMFYFLLIRPQKKQRKEQEDAQLKTWLAEQLDGISDGGSDGGQSSGQGDRNGRDAGGPGAKRSSRGSWDKAAPTTNIRGVDGDNDGHNGNGAEDNDGDMDTKMPLNVTQDLRLALGRDLVRMNLALFPFLCRLPFSP